MKELIDQLRKKDRNILGVVCLFLLVLVCLYFFFASVPKYQYFKKRDEQSLLHKNLIAKKKNIDKLKDEKRKWSFTKKDIQTLEKNVFYNKNDYQVSIRTDVEKILSDLRIKDSKIDFEYVNFEKEQFSKVKMVFTISEKYSKAKKLISKIESFDKFLILERLDFIDTDSKNGNLILKITVAGYYEN